MSMRLAGLALAGAALASAGCFSGIPRCKSCKVEHALVEYRASAQSLVPPQVEVTPTPAYEEARRSQKYRMAAIRLPDTCGRREGGTSDSAAETAGVATARQTQTILATDCGVWLAELERALTQAGFGVISWDALRQIERRYGSTYQAASALRADIVFIFNSLDVSPSNTGGAAGMRFRYFTSNERGEALEPLSLDDNARAAFRNAVTRRAGGSNAAGIPALSSTLDSTAIDTQNGQSIWFFRRTVTLPLQTAQGMRFLFARTRDQDKDWLLTTPVLPKVPPRSATFSSEDTQVEHVDYTPDNQLAAEKLMLIRAAAKDFVTRFQNGG